MRYALLLAAAALAVLAAPLAAAAQCDGSTTDTTLMDGGPFTWDITNKGSIFYGSIDSYDGGFQLLVGGAYVSAGALSMELSGRQIVHGPVAMSGLMVTRKVYVPT